MPASDANGAGFLGEVLGDFVAGSSWESVGEAPRRAATRSLVNFFGCALASCREPAVDTAARVLGAFGGTPRATAIGRRARMDLMGASFINAMAANFLDFDDTHPDTIIHPTAPVAPALLALAEDQGLSGAAVLHAFILGAEVTCRIGNAVSPGHYARGWHITATCGVFGAAAGCAKLLGLTAQQTWMALGIAASQSAGVVENLSSPAKNVGVGNAARNGLLAALLAREGFHAAHAALEGPQGWARAMGDEADVAVALAGLGTRWEIASNTFKLYPCGIVFHSMIDACLALRERFGLTAADIAAVEVGGPQLFLDRGDRVVRDERDARVSIHHCAAVALAYGRCGIPEFTPQAVTDPVITALRGKIVAKLDAGCAVGAARVRVEHVDGRSFEMHLENARGGSSLPLSDDELEQKFRANALHGGSGLSVEECMKPVWAIEDCADVSGLMARFRPRD